MYRMHKITNLLAIHKIVTIHYFEYPRDYFFPGESHDFWEMVYVDRGYAKIATDETSLVLSAGEAYFHRPNEFHAIGCHNSSAPNVCVVTFVCNSAAMDYFIHRHTVFTKEQKHLIGSLIHEARSTFQMESFTPWLTEMTLLEDGILGGQQMIRSYLEQLLISLLRTEEKHGDSNHLFRTREMMEDHLVAQMVEYMEKNIDKRLTVNDICEYMNYGRTYLSSLFKQTCGYTLMEYFSKLQMTEAKTLIRKNQHSFREISERLSFDNPNYFSRVFKRVTGMSPTEYQKSIISQEEANQ